MSQLDNLTPFAATCMPSMSCTDQLLALVVVAGRFELPRPGTPLNEAPPIAEEQRSLRLGDEYNGDPTTSSLLHEGQSTFKRPGTDIYLSGHAWSPQGQPTRRSVVQIRVGQSHKAALVFGDRVWGAGVIVRPTQPAPFHSLPLVYERCFGGSPPGLSSAATLVAEHNPVGRGLYCSERDAVGQPLPNFENPDALLQSHGDLPLPWGFGPVARHWRPRRTFGGTYDQQWVESRMPLWPKDFDERFFSAAALDLCAAPNLQGGEPVSIVGMHPDGPYEFRLPSLRLQATFELGMSRERRVMLLDAVSFEPDSASFTMFWRTHIIADLLTVAAVVVRTLAPSEVGT